MLQPEDTKCVETGRTKLIYLQSLSVRINDVNKTNMSSTVYYFIGILYTVLRISVNAIVYKYLRPLFILF